MSLMRLTNKGINSLLICNKEYANAMYNKLRKHEDYEDELGITFPTLIEVLKQDYLWFKYEDKIIKANIFERTLEESIGKWYFIVKGIPVAIDLKEGLGKTWAFTEEDLK